METAYLSLVKRYATKEELSSGMKISAVAERAVILRLTNSIAFHSPLEMKILEVVTSLTGTKPGLSKTEILEKMNDVNIKSGDDELLFNLLQNTDLLRRENAYPFNPYSLRIMKVDDAGDGRYIALKQPLDVKTEGNYRN